MKNNLKIVRKVKKYTQQRLAEVLADGISQADISAWENNRVEIPNSIAKRICSILDVGMSVLLYEEKEQEMQHIEQEDLEPDMLLSDDDVKLIVNSLNYTVTQIQNYNQIMNDDFTDINTTETIRKCNSLANVLKREYDYLF